MKYVDSQLKNISQYMREKIYRRVLIKIWNTLIADFKEVATSENDTDWHPEFPQIMLTEEVLKELRKYFVDNKLLPLETIQPSFDELLSRIKENIWEEHLEEYKRKFDEKLHAKGARDRNGTIFSYLPTNTGEGKLALSQYSELDLSNTYDTESSSDSEEIPRRRRQLLQEKEKEREKREADNISGTPVDPIKIGGPPSTETNANPASPPATESLNLSERRNSVEMYKKKKEKHKAPSSEGKKEVPRRHKKRAKKKASKTNSEETKSPLSSPSRKEPEKEDQKPVDIVETKKDKQMVKQGSKVKISNQIISEAQEPQSPINSLKEKFGPIAPIRVEGSARRTSDASSETKRPRKVEHKT